ncbi:MAG: ATP-dependent protease subunit HslV [Deltaproteobacteria bacterium]|nr:ATP-dependent protease subunit HslV [Deltaproteobacteria bacterium]
MVHATTILSVRRGAEVAMGGDGQVTLGETIIKHHARKVQRIEKIENKKVIYKVLVGFAGTAADAYNLFEKLEGKLDEYRGNLKTAAYELVKEWRSDKLLRKLDAMLAASDAQESYIISGMGDLIAPDDDIVALGSGGQIALAVARALMKRTELSASEIVQEALNITSDICIYTNKEITVEVLQIAE